MLNKFFTSLLCSLNLMIISMNAFPSINLKVSGRIQDNLSYDDSSFSQSYQSASEHDSINSLLQTSGEHKISPDPNEEINLYSGNFKLKYTDFSVAIAPGLNMEVNRTYTSGVYSFNPDNYRNENFVGSWHMGVAYIYEYQKISCDREECFALMINSDGSIREFYDYKDKDNWGQTKDNWLFDAANDTAYDPQGNKYTYGHRVPFSNHAKYFLTKIETPDGHWIEYTYDGVFINKITSSDSTKVVDIVINKTKYYQTVCVQHCDWERKRRKYQTYYFPVPETVLFNGKKIIEYSYNLLSDARTLFLTGASKPNGEVWRYVPKEYNLQSRISRTGYHTYRTQVSKVVHPSGAITTYVQEIDPDNQYSGRIYGIRLKSKTNNGVSGVVAEGSWFFNYSQGKDSNNINTKIITVTGPSHAIKNVYSDSNNDYVWRQGRILDQYVYRDNSVDDGNILQQDHYEWDKILKSDSTYSLTRTTRYPAIDQKTYSPILISKKTKLHFSNGVDSYTTEYSKFDDFDVPNRVTQYFNSNNQNNSRVIDIEYLYLKEKNILSLPVKALVDGKQILAQEYDSNGHVISSNKLGVIKKYTYSNGLLELLTDGLNNTTRYSNYNGVTPQLTEYADQTSIKQMINHDGTVASTTDANGNTTEFSYNDSGDVIYEQSPLGEGVKYDYVYSNRFKKTTTHGSSTLVEDVNFFGELNHKIENNSREFRYSYDALGRKIFESYPISNGQNSVLGHYYSYDALGRMVSDCYPVANNNCTSYEYLANNTKAVNYSNGEYVINTYKSYSNPEKSALINIKEDQRETVIQRDNLDHVLAVQQGNLTKKYEYDQNYNLIKFTEPETGVTSYKYDAVGNLIEKQQNGKSTKYELHPQNYRLLKTIYADDSYPAYYGYDANGNLLYSQKGRVENTYKYNQINKLTEETLALNKGSNEKSFKIGYGYNAENDLSSITYPDNTQIDLMPNSFGLPTQIGQYVKNINYHATNSWKNLTLGNNVSASTQLDEQQRIKNYNYGSLALKYGYDGHNNLKTLNLADSSNANYTYNLIFNYDKQGRLIDADGPWGTLVYKYDVNDNILDISNSKYAKQHLSFNYDNNNRLLNFNKIKADKLELANKFSYDPQGNITNDGDNHYVYGLDGNLLSSRHWLLTNYEYDTNQQRIVQSNMGKDTITFYTKSGLALYEIDASKNEKNKYLYFNGNKVAKVSSKIDDSKSPAKVSYFYNDAIGSPVASADEQGKILWYELYQPYGLRFLDNKNDSKINKHWFAGKEVDDTNLSYFGARYYNPNTGRFMSPDPASINSENPSSFNRYSYANNNPYKYVDPDGRLPFIALLPLVLSFIDAAITANDTYNAYHEGGFAAAGTELAVAGLISRVPGAKIAEKATKGGLNLYKWNHVTSKANKWKDGDYFLYLPNKGSPKANWQQNSGRLREVMQKGEPIRDTYRMNNGDLIVDKNKSFINAERHLLETRGWQYDNRNGYWNPPK